MIKRIAIYARTSTADNQTTENQIRELQAVAARHGWTVAGIFDDNGISGATPRESRPAMKWLLKAVARREIDMVAAWAVDRLGRSLMPSDTLIRAARIIISLRRGMARRAVPLSASHRARPTDRLPAHARPRSGVARGRGGLCSHALSTCTKASRFERRT
jgi:hypothetical protein